MDTEVKTRWTPGPWTAGEWSCHARTTIKAGDIVIAECGATGRHSDETLADALLISKAPEMADLLRKGWMLVVLMRTFCDLREPLDKSAAAKMGEFMREVEALLSTLEKI